MANYPDHLTGDFDKIIEFIHKDLWQQSSSLTLEETYQTVSGDKRVEQRAYERYSIAGGNRASLSVLFIETEDGADVCGIATGGSQAVFWKINTWGEAAFLETLESAVNRWKSNAGGLSD